MKKIVLMALLCFMTSEMVAETAKGNLNLSIEAENKPVLTETLSIQLKSAKATDIKPLIARFLSSYGSVDINPGLNMILVNDLPEKLESLKEAINKLDSPQNDYRNGMRTELIQLKYINPIDISGYIKHKLSRDGSLLVNPELNSILVSDIEPRVEEIKELVSTLDKVKRQILLKIKIVEIKYEDSQNTGIDWNELFGAGRVAFSYTPINSKTIKLAGEDLSFDNSISGKSSGFKLDLNADILNLDKLISLLMVNGVAKIISSPTLIMENDDYARFYSTQEIPYLYESKSRNSVNYKYNSTDVQKSMSRYIEPSYNNTNDRKDFTFRDNIQDNGNIQNNSYSSSSIKLDSLEFDILPHINSDSNVNMTIDVSIKSLMGLDKNNQPVIYSHNVNTKATVPNKMTFVLGGLEKRTKVNNINRMPLLGYIPIVQYLFQKKVEIIKVSQVIMLITPEIIEDPRSNVTKENIDLGALEEKLKAIKQKEKK